MKIVIVGSGLIGVTTAYFLRRCGHEVTVLDRAEGPGRETSFANGALLTPSMAEPWNTPGSWRVLLASLRRSDSPLQLRWWTLPSLAGWGFRFLRNSNVASFERSALSNLRLAVYSLRVMESLRQEASIEYGRMARGTLRIFRNATALDDASGAAERMSSEGVTSRRLSKEETIELEPALAPIADRLAGGIHYEGDETGDAYRFCVGLAAHAKEQGVDFRFGTELSSLEVESGQISAVVTEGERFVADRYVVAAGSYTAPLLQRVGVDVPVRPAKGYSITFDNQQNQSALRIPVVDDSLHAAVVPLEGAIRVAGTAEFAGYDLTLRPDRIQNLVNLIRQVLPRSQFDPSTAKPWCGLRPMSVDGVPIIGPTPMPNLYVNTGHGHLGWTMCAGSGQLLAQLMSDEETAIDAAPYALTRFDTPRTTQTTRMARP